MLASVAETHISILFFVGDRVYKLKKPVRFGFIDLSTREARRRLCHREVELNRRLAPDVYLGVVDVVDQQGRTIDHLVEMVRLPDDRRLATQIRQDTDVGPCLRALARKMAAFHQSASTSDAIASAWDWQSVRAKWRENFTEMTRFVGDPLDPDVFARVRASADRYLEGRSPLFDSRVAEGRISDGHGDLLAEDIFCLDDGPRVLDCIEFDDRLRYGDVLADVTFLAMDLERLHADDEARSFLDWYREFSGDTYPQTLSDHYIAYRALIRCKVACIKHEQGDATKRREATELLDLADAHLESARVRLVLVGGLPGTGKSTLAAGLSDATGWTVLRSDEVRKDLAGLAHKPSAHESFGHGIYSSEMTDQTYEELIRRARRLLALGESVVLDASWLNSRHRESAASVALETHSDIYELRCTLEAKCARDRMRLRARGGMDASDADERIAAAMAVNVDRWPKAVEISTGDEPAACVARALGVVRPIDPRGGRSRSGNAHDERIAG